MKAGGKSEFLMEEVIGCGSFQVLFFMLVVVLVKVTIAYTMMFMSYGNYNPGWRCLDNVTTVHGADHYNITNFQTTPATHFTGSKNQTSGLDEKELIKYLQGSCEEFKACGHVEFDPESSTVVTEWELVCDFSYVSSLIISIQMFGMVFGSYAGGQFSDLFGRKKTLYASLMCGAMLQVASSFSTSWELFAVVRFFLGVCATCNLVVVYLYMGEVMTKKWRATIMATPTWQIGTTIMALSAMKLKDWRSLELVGCVLYVIALIPVLWAPESLRWLDVKNKTEVFNKTAQKMAKLNRKNYRDVDNYKDESQPVDTTDEIDGGDGKKYTLIDLFRKGYRFKTVSVGFLFLTFSLMYYALAFGVKALYGDFYINLILTTVSEVPFGIMAMVILRILSRIKTTVLFLGLFTICVFTTVGVLFTDSSSAKEVGITLLISIGKGSLGLAWYCLYARTTEMYPTVVRGVSLGWGSAMARIGGIVAPFLIPNKSGSFFIYMLIMGSISLVCLGISIKLPETMGKPLVVRFEDREKEKEKKKENDRDGGDDCENLTKNNNINVVHT